MIIFVSNFINHHQIGVAEELFSLTNGNFRFVETIPMPESFKKSGYPYLSLRNYVIQAWQSEDSELCAKKMIMEADFVIYGGVGKVFEIVKSRINAGLLTFEMGERWLKRGWKNLLSFNLQKSFWTYHLQGWSRKPYYRLCASAYAPNDLYRLFMFKDKCYKWGYFTSVENNHDLKLNYPKDKDYLSFIWCSRFIHWKHPEMPILLAERLRHKGFHFVIDMFGSGECFESIKQQICQKKLEKHVILRGNVPNEQIIIEMRKHDVFLFTSDRNEGWGAVLNEAMANGCVPVASNEIGSVPYLIKDGSNGKIFLSCNIDSFESNVSQLFENESALRLMSNKAIETMQLWSPQVAASRLLRLIESIKKGDRNPYSEGPCSKADPIKNNA